MSTEFIEVTHSCGSKSRLQINKLVRDEDGSVKDIEITDAYVDQEIARQLWPDNVGKVISWRRTTADDLRQTMEKEKAKAGRTYMAPSRRARDA